MDKLSHPVVTARKAARSSCGFGALAGGFMILLAGCSEQPNAQLEQRLAAVEAKAEAAEKRAKAAESIALRSADSPQVMELPPPSNDNPDGEDASEADTGQVDGLENAVPPNV